MPHARDLSRLWRCMCIGRSATRLAPPPAAANRAWNAGRALCDGIVIDLTGMNRVAVGPDNRTARISGGARAADILRGWPRPSWPASGQSQRSRWPRKRQRPARICAVTRLSGMMLRPKDWPERWSTGEDRMHPRNRCRPRRGVSFNGLTTGRGPQLPAVKPQKRKISVAAQTPAETTKSPDCPQDRLLPSMGKACPRPSTNTLSTRGTAAPSA
jgi:hypothetical protein